MFNRESNLLKRLVRATMSLTRAAVPLAHAALPALVILTILLFASDASACPTCKDGLAENDPASAAQAAGYFYSILFMMAMPFLILGTLGSAAYLSIRRARDQQANAALDSTSLDAAT